MSLETYATVSYPELLRLPVEVIAEVVQYIVEADDLSGYLHLCKTCRLLYVSLWVETAEIWRSLYRALYDPVINNTDSEIEIGEASTWSDSEYGQYKKVIKGRLLAMKELKIIGMRLDENVVPWRTLPGYGTQRHLKPDTNQCVKKNSSWPTVRLPKVTHVTHALWVLTRIGADHCMIRLTTFDEKPFYSAETISKLYEIIAKIAVIDPPVLSALYRNEYESFRYIRTTLLRHEIRTIHSLLMINMSGLGYRQCFPWPMCHVFFIILFCGPSILANEALDCSSKKIPGQETDGHGVGAILRQAVPSWFNLGNSADNITPIPLTSPERIIKLTRQQLSNAGVEDSIMMAGEWTGYYAYSVFASNDQSDEENDNDDDELVAVGIQRLNPDLEYAARGIRVDKRMTFRLVDWTTDTLKNGYGGSNRKTSTETNGQVKSSKPLYLNSEKDAQVVNVADNYFRGASFKLKREVQDPDLYVDDLTDRANWGHQRVFSGRGQDAIGEFGIRGFVSERSGLVRMVKSYFNPDFQALVKDRVYFEFGDQPHQLQYDLRGNCVAWYYRGYIGSEGVIGLWYDDDVSGPFWIYRLR
ncbi:hypothetical protein BGZ46_006215 [Entomortierella lignicola]|nr:hypothetical protein BGZ46_006215 [Entomortierella lignicola]